MDLKYRYTMPPVKDSSRMDISLNDQFLQSFSLNSSQDVNKLILSLIHIYLLVLKPHHTVRKNIAGRQGENVV